MRRVLAALLLCAGTALPGLARTAVDLRIEGEGAVGEPFRMVWECTQPELETVAVNGQQYTLFHLEGEQGLIGEPGRPDLPAVHRLIGMPDRSDIQVRVVGGTSTLLEGIWPLPVQDQLHQAIEQPQPWLQDDALYTTDAWYPADVIRLDQPALIRNNRVTKCSLFPVQVNPVTGQARVWTRLELEVTFDGQNPVNTREWQLPAAATRLEGPLAASVVNPRSLADGALEDVWRDPGKYPGKYLVFASTSALGNARLQDLLAWKRQRGHVVVVESSAAIIGSATSIKNRITSEYNSSDPVKFVMLVGDVDGSYPMPTNAGGYDHFYARVEGADILGDVAVGRLSVENTTQLTTVCNKIITYERDLYLANPGWLSHASLLVGSSACYLSMKQVSRNIAAELVERRGYDDIDTLWCSSSTPVVGLFNAGMSFYNYRGWIGMEGLDGNAIQNLTQGPRTPVATIFTCDTGDFDWDDDYTEKFFRGGNATTPGGAVACMGYATSGTHTRYNNVMAVGFYHAFLEGDVPEVGSCLIHSKYELYMTLPAGDGAVENFSNWGNLMGDPGMRMWAGIPAELDTELPTYIRQNQGFLELEVQAGGQPLADVIACLQTDADGGFRSVALSDSEGRIWLDLAGVPAGNLTLTLSHHRARVIQQAVTVGVPTVDAALAGWSVDGGMAAPGTAGQALQFTVENTGSVALGGLAATLELDPALGTLTGPPISIGSLAPGATSAPLSAVLNTAADLLDGQVLPVVIHLTGDQGALDLLAPVAVAGPTLLPTAQTYPGGIWLPATSRSIQLTLQNSGSVTAGGLSATLVSDAEDFVTVTSGAVSGGPLAPGGSAPFLFQVEVTQDALVGMSVPLHLLIAANGGALQRVDLLVPVGNPGPNDPSGPDAWGYWAYEDEDNTYAQAPVYEWIEIAPPAGGPGTLVPLTDEGDEQDDMVRMALPFDFSYYGEYYDQVYISSNGFIAFAEMGVYYETDFRNHYLPSGQGPDAMIAPMWDDHLTTGTGNVYTWFDAANHRFVVEWYTMNANQSGGPNTFQVILYDPNYYPTGTGDGEFKFQYHTWNDTQEAWTDFPYCTVGFKDHTSSMGMTLKNYNELNPTMHSIGAGTAILFTTTVNGVLTPAELVTDPAGVTVEVAQGETGEAVFTLANNGQVTLVYDLHLSFDSRDGGGPDAYGYEWLDSAEPLGPDYGWVSNTGHTPVTFVHNDSTAGWYDLGFDFYLYGEPHDRVRISPNGFLSFTSHSGAWSNQPLPSDIAPLNSVFVWWDDLRPADNAMGYCTVYTNNQDSLVVSWTGVPHYNPGAYGGPFTMQAILRSNGEITLQYASMGTGNSGGVGLQGRSATEGLGIFNNLPLPAPYAIRITPPAWAVLQQDSGMITGGTSVEVPVTVSSTAGYQLPEGEYHATLHISSNDPQTPETSVPLVMQVGAVAVDQPPVLPRSTRLAGNHPNPFNPGTRIQFDLAMSGPVSLQVFNMLGQKVATLLDGELAAGSHTLDWNAANLPSGMYLLELRAGQVTDRHKVLLLK